MIELSRTIRAWQDHEKGPDAAPIQVRMHGRAARDKMVRHNLRLILKIWNDNYKSRLPMNSAGMADCLQNAAVRLMRAAEKFDGTTGRRFSTYATAWIHKGLADHQEQEARTIRIPRNNLPIIFAAIYLIRDAQGEGRPTPTWEEVAAELSKTRKGTPTATSLQRWVESFQQTDCRSFSDPLKGEDSNSTVEDLIGDVAIEEDDTPLGSARKAIEHLSDLEFSILTKRFARRVPVGRAAVAKSLKMTIERVEEIECGGIARVKAAAGVQ